MERGLGKLQSVEEEGIPSYSGITFSNPSVRVPVCVYVAVAMAEVGMGTPEKRPRRSCCWSGLALLHTNLSTFRTLAFSSLHPGLSIETKTNKLF